MTPAVYEGRAHPGCATVRGGCIVDANGQAWIVRMDKYAGIMAYAVATESLRVADGDDQSDRPDRSGR